MTKIASLYINQFMDMVAEKYSIPKDDLSNLWNASQKQKPSKKTIKKKNPSAYIIFCNERRPDLRKEHPEMKFIELSKELGRLWTGMSAEEKQPYVDRKNAAAAAIVPPPAPIMMEEEAQQDIEQPVAVAAAAAKSKRKANDIPADLTEREHDLWCQFAELKSSELRKQCEFNHLKTSRNNRDMIKALVAHRIALEDGDDHLQSTDEDTDDERSI